MATACFPNSGKVLVDQRAVRGQNELGGAISPSKSRQEAAMATTVILNLEQAVELVGRMNAAAEGRGRFSEIVMPNGKKVADCNFGYVAKVAEALQCMGW